MTRIVSRPACGTCSSTAPRSCVMACTRARSRVGSCGDRGTAATDERMTMSGHPWETASKGLWRLLAVALVAAGAAACGAGDAAIEPPPEYAAAVRSIEAFIEREMAAKELPAVSVALVDDQEIVWARGFGVARDGVPATARTVYRVGSVSKLFTDIAVMQLVERGELDLDAPVETYLPEFGPANPFGTPVTLRQLMAHRSGLVREPPVGNYFDDSGVSLAATVASLNE